MTRKIKDTIKQAALWLVAITATMFIVCSVMGGRVRATEQDFKSF